MLCADPENEGLLWTMAGILKNIAVSFCLRKERRVGSISELLGLLFWLHPRSSSIRSNLSTIRTRLLDDPTQESRIKLHVESPTGAAKAVTPADAHISHAVSPKMQQSSRMNIHPESETFSLTLPDRLPTISASQALLGLNDSPSKYVRSGIRLLDTILAGTGHVGESTAGGFERGKVTEIWGGNGAGKTAIAYVVYLLVRLCLRLC